MSSTLTDGIYETFELPMWLGLILRSLWDLYLSRTLVCMCSVTRRTSRDIEEIEEVGELLSTRVWSCITST